MCIPVHVQENLETGFTQQPIRWRRDATMTKVVVYYFLFGWSGVRGRLRPCLGGSRIGFTRPPVGRLRDARIKKIIVLAVSVGIAPLGISVMCMDFKFGTSRSPIGRRRDARLAQLIAS